MVNLHLNENACRKEEEFDYLHYLRCYYAVTFINLYVHLMFMYKYLVWTLSESARIRLYRWLRRYEAKAGKEFLKDIDVRWVIHKSFTLIFFDCKNLRKYLAQQLNRYQKHVSNDMLIFRCNSLAALDLDDDHIRKYMKYYRYTEKDLLKD